MACSQGVARPRIRARSSYCCWEGFSATRISEPTAPRAAAPSDRTVIANDQALEGVLVAFDGRVDFHAAVFVRGGIRSCHVRSRICRPYRGLGLHSRVRTRGSRRGLASGAPAGAQGTPVPVTREA